MTQKLSQTRPIVSDELEAGKIVRTDFNPDPEPILLCATNVSRNDVGLRQNDGHGQKKGNRRDVNHVTRYDAEVEDLSVEPAHLVEGCLLLSSNLAGWQWGASSRVDLYQLPAPSSRKHAGLLRLLLVRCW